MYARAKSVRKGTAIATLHLYLTFFQNWDKKKQDLNSLGHLATSIFYLSQISGFRLQLTCFSNANIRNFDEICKPIEARNDGSEYLHYVASREELIDPESKTHYDWLLTWIHKSFLRQDVAKSHKDSGDLFLVLEDDALFTSGNLDYFLKNKVELSKIGLVPGFLRSEWSTLDSCWINPEAAMPLIESSTYYSLDSNSRSCLMQTRNPFSASILLDFELAKEYLSSDSSVQKLACYKHPIIYDIGSSATLGLIMENVPIGFINRVAVVCDSRSKFPVSGAIIRHLGDRYANDKWHRNFRLYDNPSLSPLPHHRNLLDFVMRLFANDGHLVLRRYISRYLTRYL
jgi:hypothetical protein